MDSVDVKLEDLESRGYYVSCGDYIDGWYITISKSAVTFKGPTMTEVLDAALEWTERDKKRERTRSAPEAY